MPDDTIKVLVGVSNQATGERYELNLDYASTEDEMLDALAIGIKALRIEAAAVDAKLDTTTLEGRINSA